MSTPSLVSSSSTLWATASKEWIIPAKPKPGRKPKKDVAPQVKDDDEVDSKGRRIQNRAAQRAFRERKQSQLAELQARVQSYEQGEIERNVALQNIAKRLKEENESLRRENAMLKKMVTQERDMSKENGKKRWRDNSPSVYSGDYPVKRPTTACDSHAYLGHTPPFAASYLPSPPSMASSPDSNESSENTFSPNPFDSPSGNPIVFPPQHSSLSNLLDFPPHAKSTFEPGDAFPGLDCGFCNDETPCVCRELAMQQAAAERMCAASQGHKMENFDQNTIALDMDQPEIHLSSPQAPSQISILDNLPEYQPPVPLRRRTVASNSNAASVFPISTPPRATPVNCSGDPANCMACADDLFGKAFCAAVSDAAASMTPCAGCSCGAEETPVVNTTTRDALGEYCIEGSSPHSLSHPSSTLNARHSSEKTVPTNNAWRQLKSHPNVAFSDLSLLAEVVARRTKCTGPRVIVSPAPGSFTPERAVSPNVERSRVESDQPILLTDPHARYRDKEREQLGGLSASPSLAPKGVHLPCGQRRVCQVPTDAVRDALRLLDAKFSGP